MRRFPLFTALLIVSLLLSGCSDRQAYRQAHFYMGTTAEFNIAFTGRDSSGIKKACDRAGSRIAALDAMLSIFNEASIVSVINNDSGKKTVKVPMELFRLVKRAKEYFVLTQGAFDITVGPLTEIWGFGPEKKTVPDTQEVKETLRYVGLDKIELDDQSKTLIFRDPRVRIDFGGFVKGYAVDEAVKVLRRNGVTDGLVNIGGDLYCIGTNYHGKEWAIGIRDPENKSETLAVLKIRDKAVATSGSYENFYINNDKRYTHIIDPRSGDTVSNNLDSVTVIANDCATADALATAVFVLGEHKGLGLIEKLADIECLLVVSAGDAREIVMSSGMERFIKHDET